MIFYVTNNVERASGIDLSIYPEVFIVSNESSLGNLIKQKHRDRVILNHDSVLGSLDLLKKYSANILKCAQSDGSKVQIMVFKNTLQIERYCQKQKWELLNASAKLVDKFEKKITQYSWMVENSLPIVLSEVVELGNSEFSELKMKYGVPFILQFNTGHTGTGTIKIDSEDTYDKLKKKFPKRETKVAKYIDGEVYTVIACVMSDKLIRVSAVSKQLTGELELSDNPLSTVGNSWVNVDSDIAMRIQIMATQVGKVMLQDGWKGLYGIDVIVGINRGDKLYLLEVNARQQASASLETQLAHKKEASGPMDWHLKSFAGIENDLEDKELTFNVIQEVLRKKFGKVYEKYGKITKSGLYNKNLELLEEKILADIEGSINNIYIIPNKQQNLEILKIIQFFS